MELPDNLRRYVPFAWFGGPILLVLLGILLWKPGTKGIAGLLIVFAMIPPLAVVAVLLEPNST